MKRGRGFAALALLIVAGGSGAWLALGRDGGSSLRASSARITVRWRGRYPGTMVLPAMLNWCPVSRIGVLEGVAGDSGFVVALHERDSLTAGSHAVVPPDMAASAPKPAASLALRWLRLHPDTALAGYRSIAGTVRIQFAGGKASGDINGRMAAPTGVDTVVVQGVFKGVPVVTTAKGCT